MNVFLNIIAFLLCVIWFQNRLNSSPRKGLLTVVFTYIFGLFVIFVLSLFIQTEFLDGLHHLIHAGIALFVFWLWTTIVNILEFKKTGNKAHLKEDLAKGILLLIIPLILWLWLSNLTFKIGG
jgi:FtsH-binding integral membrane protein